MKFSQTHAYNSICAPLSEPCRLILRSIQRVRCLLTIAGFRVVDPHHFNRPIDLVQVTDVLNIAV